MFENFELPSFLLLSCNVIVIKHIDTAHHWCHFMYDNRTCMTESYCHYQTHGQWVTFVVDEAGIGRRPTLTASKIILQQHHNFASPARQIRYYLRARYSDKSQHSRSSTAPFIMSDYNATKTQTGDLRTILTSKRVMLFKPFWKWTTTWHDSNQSPAGSHKCWHLFFFGGLSYKFAHWFNMM